MARGAQQNAQNTYNQANGVFGNSNQNAQNLYSQLLPQLQQEVNDPQGFGKAGLAAMNTANQQSIGGATAGAVGDAGLTGRQNTKRGRRIGGGRRSGAKRTTATFAERHEYPRRKCTTSTSPEAGRIARSQRVVRKEYVRRSGSSRFAKPIDQCFNQCPRARLVPANARFEECDEPRRRWGRRWGNLWWIDKWLSATKIPSNNYNG